jgi:hypothetical protein
MKLRLQFNSIRLRLKRSEVEQFVRTGRLEEKIIFGDTGDDALHYVLEATEEISSPRAGFNAGGIHVQVPAKMALRWASGSEIGIEGDQPAGNKMRLRIIIEKDFACLDGTEEQNFDTFPNPLAGTKC